MKANTPSTASGATERPGTELHQLVRRHLGYGWWSLLIFLILGVMLEALHGFKAGLYLNVSNEMRRLLWTLAHAHGTLLALIHIAFAVTLPHVPAWAGAVRVRASRCLLASTVLLPSGFFLGGLVLHGNDPGLGIMLVPLGALLLFVAVLTTTRAFAD